LFLFYFILRTFLVFIEDLVDSYLNFISAPVGALLTGVWLVFVWSDVGHRTGAGSSFEVGSKTGAKTFQNCQKDFKELPSRARRCVKLVALNSEILFKLNLHLFKCMLTISNLILWYIVYEIIYGNYKIVLKLSTSQIFSLKNILLLAVSWILARSNND